MFWSAVVVRLPWTRRRIGPPADPPCQIYSDVPIFPMDPEGVLGMLLLGTLPELSAIAGRRPGTQTDLKAQGHLRDSLARFGGWPLPTQRGRETTLGNFSYGVWPACPDRNLSGFSSRHSRRLRHDAARNIRLPKFSSLRRECRKCRDPKVDKFFSALEALRRKKSIPD
jgi:hypothetical protein